jgi:hypothetical protein
VKKVLLQLAPLAGLILVLGGTGLIQQTSGFIELLGRFAIGIGIVGSGLAIGTLAKERRKAGSSK